MIVIPSRRKYLILSIIIFIYVLGIIIQSSNLSSSQYEFLSILRGSTSYDEVKGHVNDGPRLWKGFKEANVSNEKSYPCRNFPNHARGRPLSLRLKNDGLSFEQRMETLYVLSRALSKLEQRLDIAFILLHDSLKGQALTNRVFPWKDMISVSVSEQHAKSLRKFIKSLQNIGKKDISITYYLDTKTDLLWYIDTNTYHDIEYRLYSGCRTTNATLLMLGDLENICPRTYVDITVLHHANRKKILPYFDQMVFDRKPPVLAENILYTKAIDIAIVHAEFQFFRVAYVYNYDTMYPLQKCYFNGALLSCPSEAEKVLVQEYDKDIRKSQWGGLFVDVGGCWVSPFTETGFVKVVSRFMTEDRIKYTHLKTSEISYPCLDFPEQAKDLAIEAHPTHLDFESRMKTLYFLTRVLAEAQETLGIRFILLHETLVGQEMTKRVLPWYDHMAVSISSDDSIRLYHYIKSLSLISTKQVYSFFTDIETDLLWRIGNYSDTFFGFRLYSSCNSSEISDLMLEDAQNVCPRTFVDISVLYPATRGVIIPKLTRTHNVHRPARLSEIVYYSKLFHDSSFDTSDLEKQFPLTHVFNYETLYPLRKCELNGFFLSCPFNSSDSLAQEYKMNMLGSSYKGLQKTKYGCWVKDESNSTFVDIMQPIDPSEAELNRVATFDESPPAFLPDPRTDEFMYPCQDFPLEDKKNGVTFRKHGSGEKGLTFEIRMDSLYHLARILENIGNTLEISFILLHGSLIGQFMTRRVLPWDDDMDVSISYDDALKLEAFISSQKYIGTSNSGAKFYLGNESALVWYIDKQPHHHIEYRVYSECNTQSVEKLMLVENEDICPRTYVDITILYPSTRSAILPKLEITQARNRPKSLSEIVLYYKALDIAHRFRDMEGITPAAHIYNYETVYPLKKCVFNGIHLYCPARVEESLLQEYSKSVLESNFRGLELTSSGCWRASGVHEEKKDVKKPEPVKPKFGRFSLKGNKKT